MNEPGHPIYGFTISRERLVAGSCMGLPTMLTRYGRLMDVAWLSSLVAKTLQRFT
jgi:hypothetical protein